jgi:hypothetical protein
VGETEVSMMNFGLRIVNCGLKKKPCHSRANGNPIIPRNDWIPACAGMTQNMTRITDNE